LARKWDTREVDWERVSSATARGGHGRNVGCFRELGRHARRRRRGPGPVGIRRSHNSPEKRIAQSPVPAGRRLCSGFRVVGGLSFRINDARTLMGLVLVWPFVALGMTCFAARTTSFTGAPMVMNAIVCSRVWAAARSEYGEAWGEIGS
jgi:hypothetical protein